MSRAGRVRNRTMSCQKRSSTSNFSDMGGSRPLARDIVTDPTSVTPATARSRRPFSRPHLARVIPPVTALVDRPRLVDQVLGAYQKDLVPPALATEPADVTVVTGPAGAGKTVLLHQAHDAAVALGRQAVHLSLAATDDEPLALWTMAAQASAAAVREHDPAVAARLAALPVTSPEMSARDLRADFVDALHDLTRPLHLLLDDADAATSTGNADELAWLVRHQPDRVHLIIAGRRPPPLSMARLLVEGRLLEIGEIDLRFDVTEAGALLGASQVPMGEESLATLVEKSQGWAAALRLAAIELQHSDDPAGTVDAFSGAHRAVGEFIEGEVLAPLPADIRFFLMQTALPTSLTSELAVELTGRSDAGAVLSELNRINTLVYQVRQTPPTYRYHRLLRDYLHIQLAMQDPVRLASLELRLAHWWVDHDHVVPALRHAASAGAWEMVADLIVRHSADLILAGEHDAILDTLDGAPSWLAENSRVGAWVSAAAARKGRSTVRRRDVHPGSYDDIQHAGPSDRLQFAVATMQEVQLTGQLGDVRRSLLPGLVHEWSDSAAMMALIHATRGITHTWLGNRAEATADLQNSWCLLDAERHAAARIDIAAHLCLNAITRGDARHVRMWVDEATAAGWPTIDPVHSPWSPWVRDMAAWSAWLRMDRAEARRHADLAAAHSRPGGDYSWLTAAVLSATVTYDEKPGHRRDAVHAIRRAHRELPPTTTAPAGLMLSLASIEVPLALGIGEAGWAEQALLRLSDDDRGTPDGRVLEAQVLIAAGKTSAARALLSSIVDASSLACRSQTLEATAWALIAHLADAAGEPSRAHEFLVRALELTEDADAPRVLTFTPIHDLLIEERGRLGRLEGLADQIVAARQDLLGSRTVEKVGTLTARELDVLRDLPSLMPLDQIAKVNVVSTNTVKTHVKSIYRKLGVNGRRAAVDRARSLGLI